MKHKSAIKAAAQSEKRKERNKNMKTRCKTSIKKVEGFVSAKQPKEARSALKDAESVVMKAAGKGVFKANKASRIVSNLTHKVKAVEGNKAPTA